MSRFRKQRTIMALDLTPLIDVVFLLLIFFMVSTTFNKYGQLNVDVPTASAEKTNENIKIEIVIDKDENYFIIRDGKTSPIDIDNLSEVLSGVKEVSVTGDKNLKYQTVMDAISKIKRQGIENLGITFYE